MGNHTHLGGLHMTLLPPGFIFKMEEIYYCKKCKREERYPKDSYVLCGCKKRNKIQMERYDKQLQKIMKTETKLNLEVSRW